MSVLLLPGTAEQDDPPGSAEWETVLGVSKEHIQANPTIHVLGREPVESVGHVLMVYQMSPVLVIEWVGKTQLRNGAWPWMP